MSTINIRNARTVLGDLVKNAPQGHSLNGLSVAEIKQGANGWNAERIWPLFEAVAACCGLGSKEDAVTYCNNHLIKGTAHMVLRYDIDWNALITDAGQPKVQAEPEAVAEPVVATHVAPPTTKASTNAMAAVLAQMTAAAQQVQKVAEDEQKLTASELQQIRADLNNLAKRMGNEIADLKANGGKLSKEIEEAIEAASKSQGSAASIRAAVAAEIKDLASTTSIVVEDLAEAAAELPEIPQVDPTYTKPDWHEDVAHFISADIHGVIGGSSGAGKTFPLKQICAELGRPCKVISANENLDAETLVCQPQIKGGTSYYTDGALVHAMRHGYVLIVDEGDDIRRGEALVFNDALESRQITIPHTGEVVKAKRGFCCWFTANSIGDENGTYNREGFDESLRQRIRQVMAVPLTIEQEVAILLKIETPSGAKLTKSEAEHLVKWAHVARPLHFGVGGSEPVLRGLPSTRSLVAATEDWLGFNMKTGDTYPAMSKRKRDVREALWYPFVSTCNSEEREALKAADLWVW